MMKKQSEAKEFIRLLEKGKIRKNILPNTSTDYTAMQEEIDLKRYIKFLQSFAYDDIKACKVGMYRGD